MHLYQSIDYLIEHWCLNIRYISDSNYHALEIGLIIYKLTSTYLLYIPRLIYSVRLFNLLKF